ncbi:MAG: hypothetical protein IPM98_20605 [Lewinellaceae bacterium]|nr:hypothetical protein [Lewinellaceae bacterium]
MEEQGQVTQQKPSGDWLPSLFQAVGSVFETISTALAPGVLSAQAYFQQLLNARASLQDPLADVNESRRNTDTILIYAGTGIIALLIIAIILKKKE